MSETDTEVQAMKGPRVTVEPGERGTGRTLEQTSIQVDPETAGILRIMKADRGRSLADILREAAERGLPGVDGYKEAARAYAKGRRVGKAPATGGKPAGRAADAAQLFSSAA